jgi:hypothetical protein
MMETKSKQRERSRQWRLNNQDKIMLYEQIRKQRRREKGIKEVVRYPMTNPCGFTCFECKYNDCVIS